ncbi:hypothetical protein C8Q78DRAFT_30715 [Trametes maxima]|nr:hypothetical protein C8Q78DRAFT_30715 [Trametes maxima]
MTSRGFYSEPTGVSPETILCKESRLWCNIALSLEKAFNSRTGAEIEADIDGPTVSAQEHEHAGRIAPRTAEACIPCKRGALCGGARREVSPERVRDPGSSSRGVAAFVRPILPAWRTCVLALQDVSVSPHVRGRDLRRSIDDKRQRGPRWARLLTLNSEDGTESAWGRVLHIMSVGHPPSTSTTTRYVRPGFTMKAPVLTAIGRAESVFRRNVRVEVPRTRRREHTCRSVRRRVGWNAFFFSDENIAHMVAGIASSRQNTGYRHSSLLRIRHGLFGLKTLSHSSRLLGSQPRPKHSDDLGAEDLENVVIEHTLKETSRWDYTVFKGTSRHMIFKHDERHHSHPRHEPEKGVWQISESRWTKNDQRMLYRAIAKCAAYSTAAQG